MKIKGIEFNVNAASGSLGWFGEGYWYHKIFAFLFPSFKRTMASINFVSKTTTWEKNEGNLPLDKNFEPKELFPDCIKIYPLQRMMLNSVNLSGPGFKALLSSGKFRNIKRDSFGISFMPIGETIWEMLRETKGFCNKVIDDNGFQSPIWIQVNLSCPNTIKSDGQILIHMKDILGIFQPLRKKYGLVLDLKVNYLVSNQLIADICEHDLCDVITISNTIKFGNQDSGIPWKRLFWWRRSSPLAKFGGGGLSGKPLFNAVCHKIFSLRKDGIKIPIKASGGIFSFLDVRAMKVCGADAIEFATVISLRPWRVAKIVKEAERIF